MLGDWTHFDLPIALLGHEVYKPHVCGEMKWLCGEQHTLWCGVNPRLFLPYLPSGLFFTTINIQLLLIISHNFLQFLTLSKPSFIEMNPNNHSTNLTHDLVETNHVEVVQWSIRNVVGPSGLETEKERCPLKNIGIPSIVDIARRKSVSMSWVDIYEDSKHENVLANDHFWQRICDVYHSKH